MSLKYYIEEIPYELVDYDSLWDIYFSLDFLEQEGVCIIDYDLSDGGINYNLVGDIFKHLQDADYDFKYEIEEVDDDAEYAKSVIQTIEYYFHKDNNKPFTNRDINRLYKLIIKYNRTSLSRLEEINEIIIPILEILKGIGYKGQIIRGYSQGDYAYCVYPKSWDSQIDFLEAVYFGTGTMFHVYETPAESFEEVDKDDYFDEYTYLWNDASLQQWAADLINKPGCSANDIVIIKQEVN